MSARVTSPALVGRGDQLTALQDGLSRARRDGPSAILIGGEAGVGKSRLVSEFAASAAAAGARVLIGGCLELGADGLPFAPFTAVLRDLVRDLGAAAVAELLPGRAARELARLLPEFGEPRRPDAEGDQAEARARLFEQMLTLLEHLAERGPVVLIVEDAHWADRSTRDLLSFLIGNQRILEGVLIVATFRSDELHRTHPLRSLLAELDRIEWVERTELPRLSRREAAELVAGILGRDPELLLLDKVFLRTAGNPLFMEELLCSDGELSLELPESLRDLLLASVQRLPEETQEVLRVASTGGDRVGHSLVAAVAGLGDDQLSRALRPAVAGNVLLTDSDGYAFRHTLIREAVHDDLLPGEHGRLHTRFAEALEADPSLVPAGRAASQLAHHWFSAHDLTHALISAWQAAAEAGRALAHAEQLTMLARVLELWDKVPGAAERIGADHLRVVEEAIEVAHTTAESERGLAFTIAALKEVDPGTEPVRAALLLEWRARLKGHARVNDGIDDLRQALTLLSGLPADRERARVLATLAKQLHKVSDEAGARAAALDALSLAVECGDAATEASALLSLALLEPALWPQGHDDRPAGGGIRPEDGGARPEDSGARPDGGAAGSAGRDSWPFDALARARAAADRAGDYQLLQHVTITESHVLEGLGAHERAAEVARGGMTSAQEYGLARTTGAILAINLAEPLWSLGRWDEAAEIIERALDVSRSSAARAELRRLSGEIALARGDLAAVSGAAASARALFSSVRFHSDHYLPIFRLETELHLAEGSPAAALSAIEEALGLSDLQSNARYGWPAVATGARACAYVASMPVATRDEAVVEKAAALLDRLRTEAAKLDVTGPLRRAHRLTFDAEAARAEAAAGGGPAGSAAADQIAHASLLAAWEAAAAAWDDVNEPYPLAIALLRTAQAAMGAGDRSLAAEQLQRAAALAAGLGARPLLSEIALFAGRARIALDDDADQGAGPGSSMPPDAAEDGAAAMARLGLTRRECEVLRLVAAGLSNAGIAGELFISAKTASVHVSNILAKLGVATRGEAAAIAHQLHFFDSPPAAEAR